MPSFDVPSAGRAGGARSLMRLLAVCPVTHPGGAEIGLLRLLDRRDWDVTLATPGDGPLREAARTRGWATATLALGGLGRRTGARAITQLPRARRLASAHDVTYLNGTVAGRLLPGLRGRRTVLHVHDMVTRVPRLWRAADLVLADSNAVAARLDGLPACVVGCPVELDPAPVPAPWPEGGAPVVGFVGRPEWRKGVDVLLAAVPALREAGARVVLVGDDPFAEDGSYARRVTSSPDVLHVPWVEDAAGLMGALDVLVLPSRSEPFGTVLAEAMAAGTPVVASRVDGLPEVVDDGVTGALVPPEDPAALAEAVVRVLADRDRMGAAARQRAKRWDADGYAERVGALIESL